MSTAAILAQLQPTGLHRKDRAYRRQNGIYYTPDDLALVLADWAIRRADDTVLDPSYGGCAFLSAARIILQQRGSPSAGQRIYGIDRDSGARVHGQSLIGQGVPQKNLLQRDFLSVQPSELPQIAALVGNPPYIRHHSLTQEDREQAYAAIGSGEYTISRRASYWAYFVLHALRFLSPGGRIALILPGAILDAAYAAPVRRAILSQFQQTLVICLSERMFPHTEESSVLILAEGSARPFVSAKLVEAAGVDDLARILRESSGSDLYSTDKQWRSSLVSERIRDLYQTIVKRGVGSPLGAAASIHIGCVTGANHYFIIGSATQRKWSISDDCVQPILSHVADVGKKLKFTQDDARSFQESIKRNRILIPPENAPLPQGLEHYYKEGEIEGIHKRQKCVSRSPWYRITDRQRPDAFLTYMTWHGPRIILNESKIDCTNTIHRLHWTDAGRRRQYATVLAMLSTITQLGSEMLGRSYGGGVLKLEPSAARELWVPSVSGDAKVLFEQTSKLLEEGQVETATLLIDSAVGCALGLQSNELQLLRDELARLRNRRMQRGKTDMQPI